MKHLILLLVEDLTSWREYIEEKYQEAKQTMEKISAYHCPFCRENSEFVNLRKEKLNQCLLFVEMVLQSLNKPCSLLELGIDQVLFCQLSLEELPSTLRAKVGEWVPSQRRKLLRKIELADAALLWLDFNDQ